MPHIRLSPEIPGIQGLMAFRPETAKPLLALAEELLRAPSSLSRGERELVATYVSAKNGCGFCSRSHAAFARAQLAERADAADEVLAGTIPGSVSPKLRALLVIAGAAAESGKRVTDELVASARSEGATDIEIHDTVLIAAAFCMFNRYVDGLGAITPDDPAAYAGMANRIVHEGYAT